MNLLRDWLDFITGYDRRGVRVLLVIVAVNIVVFGVIFLSARGSGSTPEPLCPDGLFAIPRSNHIDCVNQQEYTEWNQEIVNQTIGTVIAENPDEATPLAGEQTAN